MGPDEARKLIEFDKALALGQPVEVRWTSCGGVYHGEATVSKLNAQSLRAKLTKAVARYPEGFEVTVPRFTFNAMKRWTQNNGAFPIEPTAPAPIPDLGAVDRLRQTLTRNKNQCGTGGQPAPPSGGNL